MVKRRDNVLKICYNNKLNKLMKNPMQYIPDEIFKNINPKMIALKYKKDNEYLINQNEN